MDRQPADDRRRQLDPTSAGGGRPRSRRVPGGRRPLPAVRRRRLVRQAGRRRDERRDLDRRPAADRQLPRPCGAEGGARRGAASDAPLADALRADLDLAIELAETAVDLLADRESLGVLGERLQAGGHGRPATPHSVLDRGDDELPQGRRSEPAHPLRRRERAAAGVAPRRRERGMGAGVESSNAPHRARRRSSRTRRRHRVDQRRADAVDFWTKMRHRRPRPDATDRRRR